MGSNHQELEAVWREKWHKAKRNLELARIHYYEVEKVASVPEEDYQRSLQALAVAVTEYARVLRIYTDLRVHGKAPDDS